MLYPLSWLLPEAQIALSPSLPNSSQPLLHQSIAKAQPEQRVTPVNQPIVQGLPLELSFSHGEQLSQVNQRAFEYFQNVVYSQPDQNGQLYVLKQGSRGEAVRTVQIRLQTLTYYSGQLDGLFGPLTEQAVKLFQGAEKLEVDGIVGPQTWNRLQQKSLVHPSTGVASTNVARADARPIFTPAQLPLVEFHAIEVSPSPPSTKLVWVAVLTLTVAGGAIYFKPDGLSLNKQRQRAQIQRSTTVRSATIHRPQPVYPATWKTCAQADTQASPTIAVNQPVEAQSSSQPTADQWSAALHQLSQETPWTAATAVGYLSDFLYDLQIPASRQQLEAKVNATATTIKDPVEVAGIADLLQRLGRFPAANRRTGHAYTYFLVDDLGGCFRMCDNELWITSMAQHWLSDYMPYTVTVRRIDYTGKVVDKDFTVTLKSLQLPLAS